MQNQTLLKVKRTAMPMMRKEMVVKMKGMATISFTALEAPRSL